MDIPEYKTKLRENARIRANNKKYLAEHEALLEKARDACEEMSALFRATSVQWNGEITQMQANLRKWLKAADAIIPLQKRLAELEKSGGEPEVQVALKKQIEHLHDKAMPLLQRMKSSLDTLGGRDFKLVGRKVKAILAIKP